MTSPFEKFLEELEAQKTSKTGTSPAAPAPAGPGDAVMSDSGLFDANAMVPAKPAAKPPAGKPAAKPPAAPPAKAPTITGADAVMSDSGLFDVRELVGEKKPSAPPAPAAKPPAGKPAAKPPAAPPAKAPTITGADAVMSDSGLFDVRELVGEVKPKAPAVNPFSQPASLGGAKPPAGKPGLPGESSSSKMPPLGGGAPAKAPKMPTIDDNPIMSDSGLFDVRELVGSLPKGPGPGGGPGAKPPPPAPDSASKMGMKSIKPVSEISKTGMKSMTTPLDAGAKPPAARPGGPGADASKGRMPAVGSGAKPAAGGGSSARNPAVKGPPPPAGKKPAADLDNIVAMREDKNQLAEDKIDRQARAKGGAAPAAMPPDRGGEQKPGLPIGMLILLLVFVVVGGGFAAWLFMS